MNTPTSLSLLHLAKGQPHDAIWTNTFRRALAPLGNVKVIADAGKMPVEEQLALIRECDVLLAGWNSNPIPPEITQNPGKLRYVCNITGGMRGFIPIEIITAGIPVTNWGTAPAFEVAEGALTLLLAMLKNLRGHIDEKRKGEWTGNFSETGSASLGGSLRNIRVGLYGLGMIGRKFVEMLRPFGCAISAYDPFAGDWPADVRRVETLEELFSTAEAVSIHAGVNDSTRKSVTAELLSLLPDHGIVINTARGEILDQDALFAELESGRLRAGLDVLSDGDSLPPEHPARQWPNLILSAHAIGIPNWPVPQKHPECPLQIFHEVCVENLGRFSRGEPLRYTISEAQYQRMT